MNEKGLLSIEELDEHKKQVAKRLVRNFVESGIGLLYQDSECDKYTFEHEAQVDCLSRLSAANLPSRSLKKDVEEGVIH